MLYPSSVRDERKPTVNRDFTIDSRGTVSKKPKLLIYQGHHVILGGTVEY
jgi:hypothetical protein